jgi:O-antigen ligase
MAKAFLLATILSVILFAWLKTGDRYLNYAHDYKTTIFHKDFSKHLISTYKLKDLSTEERFYRWIAAIRMVKDNWLSGTGPNTFYPVYKEYAVPAFKTYVSDNPEHSTVHNYFLLMIVEQGIPGLLLFILLAVFVFYYAQKNYHNAVNRTDQLIAITAGTVFAMILVLNFLSDLIETDKIGSLYFLCIAVLVGRDRDYVAR